MPMKVTYSGSSTLSSVVKGRVQRTRADISRRVASLWRTKVRNSSLSPRAKKRYEDAIQPYKSGYKAGAYLTDKVAALLETGYKAFDMKPGLLAGMMRRAIPVQDANGNKNIRTVSLTSPGKSWRHPGIKGQNLKSRVERSVQRIVKEAIAKGKE